MERKATYEKKNIVIAGGAGFIGSHLCAELVKTARVICIDNFLTGSEENIHQLLESPDFKFIRHDVTVPIDLEAFPELKLFRIPFQGIQEIYNLACPTSPKEYNRFRVETLLANALGTKNLLDIAAKYKAKFLHLSSSAIYGEPLEEGPFQEAYWGFVDPIGPRSSYIEGKRFAESLVVNFGDHYHLETKLLRVFNTYGPKMKLTDGRMIPDFVNDALQGNDLAIFGDEKSFSTFNYISDLIEAVLKMMASPERGPLNIGHPEIQQMKKVAELILKMTGSPGKVVFHEPLPYTAKQGVAD
ncbi:MAG: NAD-dependent epimerase/dehydratase family protein, partial [bacterium]